MKFSPINFQSSYGNPQVSAYKSAETPQLPHNSLRDMEFDIVADKIRSKCQMNMSMPQLKSRLNNFIKK